MYALHGNFPAKQLLMRVLDLCAVPWQQNAKTGVFLPKSASFQLLEEDESGGENKLGSANIDLASFATPEKSTDKVELDLMDGKIRLHLTLSSHWLKSMAASMDDDDASISSFGSGVPSEVSNLGASDDEIDVTQWTSRSSVGGASSDGAGLEGRTATVLGGGNAPNEREVSDAARAKAIEKRWDEEAGRSQGAQVEEALLAEVNEAREQLRQSHKEVKSLRGRVEHLASENRVLRREQRGGKRDEVILQLESELSRKDIERAEMEENLAKAFGGALDEAHARISALTVERDRLLVSLDEVATRKGGFMRSK
jgi:hypothetical protein